MSAEHEVGYKKPPVSSRFVKGKSGNPRGRPKGSTNFKSDLEAELKELVQIREGDRQAKVTKQRAIVKILVAGTIKGDRKAAASLLSLVLKLLDHQSEPNAKDEPSANDVAIIEAALLRRQAPQSAPTASADIGAGHESGQDGLSYEQV